ncbi:MAG: phosphotransferase [Psychromonas sp.]
MSFLPDEQLTKDELTWISARNMGALVSVQPLKLALSNEVFLLTFSNGQKTVFKRLNQTVRDPHDRSCELRVHQLANDAGFTPKVLVCNALYQLQEYFPGDVLSNSPLTSQTLKQLALQLTKIHQLPAVHARPQRLAASLRQLKEKTDKPVDAAVFSRILNRAIALDNSSPKNCLCHGDLSLNNLLINDRQQIKILDWEYAALACPAYDLASCICINALNTLQQEALLREYYLLNKEHLSRSLVVLQQECSVYLTVFDYLNALWANCFIAD